MLGILISYNIYAEDSIPNIINELQHTQTRYHPGHIAFSKMYSRVDYTNTFISKSLPHLNNYNAEFGYSFNTVSLGVLYNNDRQINTITSNYSAIAAIKVLNKKVSWIFSGGFHVTSKHFQQEGMLFWNEELSSFNPLENINQNFYILSISNLITYKGVYVSLSITDIPLVPEFERGMSIDYYSYNLIGYKANIAKVALNSSIEFNIPLFTHSLKQIFLDKYISFGLTGQYKQYIAGFRLNSSPVPGLIGLSHSSNYMLGAGYNVYKTFIVNINYLNSFQNHVNQFQISLVYHK